MDVRKEFMGGGCFTSLHFGQPYIGTVDMLGSDLLNNAKMKISTSEC